MLAYVWCFGVVWLVWCDLYLVFICVTVCLTGCIIVLDLLFIDGWWFLLFLVVTFDYIVWFIVQLACWVFCFVLLGWWIICVSCWVGCCFINGFVILVCLLYFVVWLVCLIWFDCCFGYCLYMCLLLIWLWEICWLINMRCLWCGWLVGGYVLICLWVCFECGVVWIYCCLLFTCVFACVVLV